MGSEERQRLHALYRRAVVLRAELRGAAMLRPVAYAFEAHEGARYRRLRDDLASVGIAIASGEPVFPARRYRYTDGQMILALDGALGEIEARLSPGGTAAVTLAAFCPS